MGYGQPKLVAKRMKDSGHKQEINKCKILFANNFQKKNKFTGLSGTRHFIVKRRRFMCSGAEILWVGSDMVECMEARLCRCEDILSVVVPWSLKSRYRYS